MTRRSFVCFAGEDWWYHGRAHANLQVTRELSRHGRALVVNSIGMRFPRPGKTEGATMRIRRKLRSTLRFVQRPLPGYPDLWVMTPISVPLYGVPVLRKINAASVGLQVWIVARLLLRTRDPWTIVVVPTAVDVVDRLGWRKVLYYRADNHAVADDVDEQLIRSMEDRLFARSAYVLYSSSALMAAETDRSGGKARFVDHGVELDHFVLRPELDEPADLKGTPRPIVGFYGAIESQWVDIELLKRIAVEIPEATLVLIGSSTSELSELRALPNVRVLGWRDYENLPRYGQRFDVALCPFRDTDWIRASNPIKVKEYLAQGCPVVSRYIPNLEHHRDVVTLVKTNDEFVAAVRDILEGRAMSTAEERRKAVLADGWEQRARAVLELCDEAEAHAAVAG